MAKVDIREQLAAKFAQPLDAGAQRRVVIWHDPEGEFAEAYGEIAADGEVLFGDVAVACVEAHDGNMFATKRLLVRERPKTNYLVYRRTSKGALAGDWLADIELYSEHFQSDYLSLLVADLEAEDTASVREGLARFRDFFRAKERIQKFKRKMSHAVSKDDVMLGVLAVLCGAESATASEIVLVFLRCAAKSLEGPEALDHLVNTLEKYEAIEPFRRLLGHITGYEGDIADARNLLSHLLLTALSATMSPEALHGLEDDISQSHAAFCLEAVREWYARGGSSVSSDLHDACRTVEEERNLAHRFAEIPLVQLLESDVFPCLNEAILHDVVGSLAKGADRREDVSALLASRGSMMWYEPYESYFDCIAAATDMQAFSIEHTNDFHIGKATEVWEAYTQDWWTMDAAYRRFCEAYQRSRHVRGVLDDVTRDLSDAMDALYTNWFLANANGCWVDAACEQWADRGFIEGIPRQTDFYVDQVIPTFSSGKCVVVGISDGMRYGVGQDLARVLERETKGVAQVFAMQSVFPSVTKFGMAALLPHVRMSYDAAKDAVEADGMPTRSIAERQKVLQKKRPESKAIQFEDLLGMRSSELKELVSGCDLLYVYQNTIDHAGHDEKGGQDVFEACDKAIEDMTSLVKMAVKDMGARDVIITADHGFLYTHREFREMDEVGRQVISAEPTRVERRFVQAPPDASSETLLRIAQDDLDEGAFSWWAARDCVRIKVPGASKHYVHGGVSLQEMCVPVVKFRNMRASTKGYVEVHPASLQLLLSNRRITSSIFNLELFQKEPVGGKVTAEDYELVLTDASGNEVSDSRIVRADRESLDEKQRVVRVKFALKPGRQWSSAETYYLVARNAKNGAIDWKEPFSIEVAFAPVDDFGW